MKKSLLFLTILLAFVFVSCGPSHDTPLPPSVGGTPTPVTPIQGIFYWPPVTQTVDGQAIPPKEYWVRCYSGSNIAVEKAVYWEVNGNEIDVDMYKVLDTGVNATYECFAKGYSPATYTTPVRDGDWSSEGVQFTVENRIIK